jgi:hypothetical protein
MSKGRLDHLGDQLGIRIVPRERRTRPRETRARRTLWKLLMRHGEGHVVFVLKTIVQSRNNAAELQSETIMAVSDAVLARPQWAERAGAFMEAFDRIPLGELRKEAAGLSIGSKRTAMGVMIAMHLKSILEPEQQGRLI